MTLVAKDEELTGVARDKVEFTGLSRKEELFTGLAREEVLLTKTGAASEVELAVVLTLAAKDVAFVGALIAVLTLAVTASVALEIFVVMITANAIPVAFELLRV